MSVQCQMFEENFWAENGFDELRRLMKQGSDFVKEVMSILHERSEMEKKYTNNLLQLSKKAKKANSLTVGSLSEVWNKFVESLESEAEMHKNQMQELQQQCYTPLKNFLENKIRQRKPLEQAVERNKKTYQDRFSDQMKYKRSAHSRCRELEQNLDQLEVLRRRGTATEKEVAKMDQKCRKSEESLLKSDREYKDSNLKTEEARLSWESSMYRCCRHLESLEHTRLEELTDIFQKYSQILLSLVTPLQETCDELTESVNLVSADRDIEYLCQNCGTGPNNPEQLLLDTYEEEVNNSMNSERRESSLDRKIQELEVDIDRKEKEKKGVETLSVAYEKTPDFVDEQGAADVTRQLIDANAMLNMLKANHFKLLKSRSELSSLPSPDSPYSEFITTRRDRQSQVMSLLCVPINQISELEEQTQGFTTWKPPTSNEATGGTRKRPLSSYEETRNEYNEKQPGIDENDYHYICRCEVLYDYQGQQIDELSIVPGDSIFVTEKIDEDWWQGNLNGVIGIFPANYVEEVEMYD